jgi:hypothetical protein
MTKLPGLLIKQGRGEEAERLRRFGLNPDGSIACVSPDVVPQVPKVAFSKVRRALDRQNQPRAHRPA